MCPCHCIATWTADSKIFYNNFMFLHWLRSITRPYWINIKCHEKFIAVLT